MKIISISIAGTLALFLFNSCGSDSSNTAQNKTVDNTGVIVYIEPGAVEKGQWAYGTNPLVISPNTRVTWINRDNIPHTATSSTGVFDSGSIAPGQNYSYIFQNVGSYPYYSSIPGEISMSGTIQVGTSGVVTTPSIPPPSSNPSPTPQATSNTPSTTPDSTPDPFHDATPYSQPNSPASYPNSNGSGPKKPVSTQPIPKPDYPAPLIANVPPPSPPPPLPPPPPPPPPPNPQWPWSTTPPPPLSWQPPWPSGPISPPAQPWPSSWPGAPIPPPQPWPGGPISPPPWTGGGSIPPPGPPPGPGPAQPPGPPPGPPWSGGPIPPQAPPPWPAGP